jgi:aquaporin Z
MPRTTTRGAGALAALAAVAVTALAEPFEVGSATLTWAGRSAARSDRNRDPFSLFSACQEMPVTLERKLTVEFIGTFFLVFTIRMAVATAGALAPLAIGAVLMGMVFAGGHVSGAHYNPAVSTAVFVRGKISRDEYLAYVVTQVAAGIVAAVVVTIIGYDPANAAKVAGAGKMLVVEFLFTFALAHVVLNVGTAKGTEGNSFYGLAIGFTVAAGAFAVGGVSGGAFNPAVAIGAMVLGLLSWGDIWIYLIANIAGAVAAANVFLFIQPAEKLEGDLRAGEVQEASAA